MNEPPAKKPRREECEGVEEGLVAYNGLREVMDNKTPLPHFWQLCRASETFLNTVITVSVGVWSVHVFVWKV